MLSFSTLVQFNDIDVTLKEGLLILLGLLFHNANKKITKILVKTNQQIRVVSRHKFGQMMFNLEITLKFITKKNNF